MNERKLLAVDMGAESGRGILGSFNGERLSLSEVHRFANVAVPLPDGLHWDVLNLWSEVRRALNLAVQASGKTLAGVGIDTWGVDFGLLDRQGALLGNPYHYRDSRTDGMMNAAYQRLPRSDIFAQTGTQFLQFNTLYQLLAMVTRGSAQLAAAETILTMADLFNYWLTGVKVSELTIASTTQCYDPLRKTWARPVLQRLGIPDHIFPEIVSPGSVLGKMRDALAAEVGMSLPVIATACHDTGAAVAAVPSLDPNHIWISSGTWSIMGVNMLKPVINEQALACGFTNETGVDGTFRLSKNIMGLWPVQESRRTWTGEGIRYSYDELTRLAAEAEPLRSLVDCDHDDFLKPGDMPAHVRAWCLRTGQPVPETHGQITRCLLESLALKYRLTLEHLEGLIGQAGKSHHFDTIHIVGGGTKNRLLSQLTADATQRRVITGPVEATAVGNLLVQAIALGEIATLEEAREVVRRSFDVETFEPDPDRRAAYDDASALLQQKLNV